MPPIGNGFLLNLTSSGRRSVPLCTFCTNESYLREVKGLAAATSTILFTPNERRVAEDRRDCYWLYIVTHCASDPKLEEPVKDPARLKWHEVNKIQHYWLEVASIKKSDHPSGRKLMVREDSSPFGENH